MEMENEKSGHYFYIFKSFNVFMDEMSSSDSMYWHEVIFKNRECRYYLDCESDDSTVVESLKDETAVNSYIKLIHQEFVKMIPCVQPPHVLTASRSDKFSLHMIWDVWAPDPSHVHSVAERINEMKIMDVKIDLQVYPAGALTHPFRLPFQCKRGVPDSKLVPFNKNQQTLDEFCKYVITFNHSHAPMWFKTEKREIVAFEGRQTKKTKVQDNPVFEWFKLTSPRFSPVTPVESNGVVKFYSKMWCGGLDRMHESNLTSIMINERKDTIVTMCMDKEECCKGKKCAVSCSGASKKINLNMEMLRFLYLKN